MDERNTEEPRQEKSWFENNPRKTLAFTAVFFILLMDAVAGAIFVPPDYHSFRCSSPYYHHDFLPNQSVETAWGGRKYRIFTNSLGFRDREIREVPLVSKKKRILLMGDSFIEGLGVLYENCVAGILGESLKDRGIEVLDAAAISYSPKLYYLKTKYLIEQKHLAFDELYVFIDISDPHDEVIYKYWKPGRGDVFSAYLRALNKFLKKHSLVCFSVSRGLSGQKAINNAVPADAQIWYGDLKGYLKRADPEEGKDRFLWPVNQSAFNQWGREGLDLCRVYMDDIKNLCDAHGIPLTIVVYPTPYQLFSNDLDSIQAKFWRTFSQERGIGFLNLFPDFFGGDPATVVDAKYYIKGDIHWNEAGNRYVAEHVLKHIKEGLR